MTGLKVSGVGTGLSSEATSSAAGTGVPFNSVPRRNSFKASCKLIIRRKTRRLSTTSVDLSKDSPTPSNEELARRALLPPLAAGPSWSRKPSEGSRSASSRGPNLLKLALHAWSSSRSLVCVRSLLIITYPPLQKKITCRDGVAKWSDISEAFGLPPSPDKKWHLSHKGKKLASAATGICAEAAQHLCAQEI